MNASLIPIDSCPERTVRRLPLRAGEALDNAAFYELRSRALLEGCKWDPQVGDVSTLASFPLLLPKAEWTRLAKWAEQLTAEAFATELELANEHPELLDRLGLPRAVRRALRRDAPFTATALRWLRFDFHFTTEGWRISEANSDVPGGFTESSFFTELIAEHAIDAQPAGNPAREWADALVNVANDSGAIALVAAPGYMEDQQIVAYMASLLRARDCDVRLTHPAQLAWRNGHAFTNSCDKAEPVAAIVRFFQGEWLAALPWRSGWQHFFRGGKTPLANPGVAVISESKRFPLTWDYLKTPMPAWRALLPETRDPRNAPWESNDEWLLKTSMCNTGDTVSIRARMAARKWRRVQWDVMLHPGTWVAQRRFHTLPIETPLGAMYPCIGVYTVNGKACGAYARLAHSEIVDFTAVDVALLVED
jgi:glutathionylspermidine synthase